ncbi:MAG: hypothetical protein KAT26_10895 [Marinosulfonomonas sp.]|nr:hypothetical protein [Marinosulfonomonas sp.]
MIRKILQSSITHVLFAFCAMGAWALYANWAHPMPKPLIAGVVQGALSASITLFLKKIIEALSARFPLGTALWAPPLIACTFSLALLVGAHILATTPEILRTIALPYSVATTYAVVYNYLIWKIRKNHNGK